MKQYTFLFSLLLFFSCARVSSPMGGPEDETPPSLIVSVPKNQQTNYQSNVITLVFDEWVTTKNIETDLIITPKLNGGFKTRIKKQQVQLIFNEPFNPNTTYTLSFANSITDITNDNPIVGLTLSFATGAVLDSLEITGTITKLYEQEPAEDYLISLYNENDSLNILEGAASYYTKTDTLGNYAFQNLPAGKYRIYALNDKNNNSKADTEAERFGFYPDTIPLTENLSGIDFTVQNLNVDEPRITSARPFGHYFDIEINKAITHFKVLQNDSKNKSYIKIGDNKVRFFNQTLTYNDTTDLIISLADSARFELRDTLDYYFIETKLNKDDFQVSIEPTNGLLNPSDSLIFTFNKPVARINLDSLYFELDSLNNLPIDPEKLNWSISRDKLYVSTQNEELYANGRKNVMLKLKSTAFISIENDTIEIQDKYLAPVKSEDVASIEGKVTTSSENIIVQLLNGRSKNLIASSSQKSYKFNYIGPGQYLIRVIDDLNGNGKWDTGNILTGEIPEPVHYYYDDFYKTRLIEVRKRWETVDINISF